MPQRAKGKISFQLFQIDRLRQKWLKLSEVSAPSTTSNDSRASFESKEKRNTAGEKKSIRLSQCQLCNKIAPFSQCRIVSEREERIRVIISHIVDHKKTLKECRRFVLTKERRVVCQSHFAKIDIKLNKIIQQCMSHVKIMDDCDKIRVKCMCSLVSQFIRLTQIDKWTKIVWNNARKDLVVTKGWKREADGWETEEEMMSLSQLKEKDDADETERERQKEINEIKESLRSLMRQERFTYLEREILNTFMDVPSFAVHIVSSSRNMETANTDFDTKRCALCNQRVGHRVLRHHKTNECFVPYRYRMLYLCRMFEGEFKRCWICSTRIGNREHTCRLEPKECQRCKDNGFAGRMDHRQHTGVCQVLQYCHEQMNWLPTMEEMVEIMRDKQKVSWDWTEWLTSEERVIQEERAEKEKRELEKGDVAKEKKSDEKVSAEVVATGQIESVTEDPSTEPSKDEGSVEESAKVMLIPKPPVIEMPGTADKPVVTTSKAVTKSSPNKVSANEKAVVQNAQMQSTHESPQPQKSLATFMEHFHQRNKKTQGSEKALQKPKENKEEFVSTNPDLDLEYLRRTGREDHKKMRMEQEKKEGRKKEGAKCQE